MRIRTLVAGVALTAIALLSVPAIAQATDPWIGTWKLNVAKSKYSPGPAPKSTTVTITASANGFHQVVDSVPASGPAQKWEVTATFDGKDCPVKGNNPNADAIAYKRIDARTYEAISKRGGKVTQTARITVSADGKTRTNTVTGVNPEGQKVNNITVSEKQ